MRECQLVSLAAAHVLNNVAGPSAQLERDTLVTRERQRRLQNDLEAMGAHLQQKEQMIVELRRKQDYLVDHLNRQQVARYRGFFILRGQSLMFARKSMYVKSPSIASFTLRAFSRRFYQ